MRRVIFALLVVLVGTLTGVAQSPKSSSKKALPPGTGSVYQKTIRSVVWVYDPIGNGMARTGSGTLIDVKDRIVVTNYHVVRQDDEVQCLFPIFDLEGRPVTERQQYQAMVQSGKAPKGKVLVKIPKQDLALIQLDHIPKDAPAVRLAKSGVGQGDNIHCIGNAGASGGLWNYVKGEVRNVAFQRVNTSGGKDKSDSFRLECRLIEHSALVNKGDSGGPVLNDAGELVGVTQGHVPDEVARGISLAVDLSEVKDFLKGNKYARLTVYQPGAVAAAEKPKVETAADAAPADPKAEAEKQEKAARAKLDFAKEFIKEGKKDKARERLESILKDYPNSAVAGEAKKLLDEIK